MGGGTGQPATGATPTTPTPTASSLPTWAASMASSVAPNLGFPAPALASPKSGGSSLTPGAGAGNTAAGFQNVPLLGGADVPHIGTKKPPPAPVEAPAPAAATPPPAPAAPSTDQVLVYTQPSWGYQSDWRNGGDQFNDAGVYSKTGPVVDPKVWDTFGAGWGAPIGSGWGIDPYQSSVPAQTGQAAVAASGLKQGDVMTQEQAATLPHMSKGLYDLNMSAYGNPYGPAVDARNRQYYDYLQKLNNVGAYTPGPSGPGS